MSDNKFLLRLKGQQTPKSVVEVQNDKLVAPFVGVPQSTDTVGGVIVDKDSSVVVAKGAQNWQIDGSALTPATTLYGDGRDFLSEYVATNSLWINASYIFPQTGDPKHPVAEIFNAQTKWVLQLCGKNLLSKNQSTIPFTFVVQIGTATIMTKTVTVAEQAGVFRKLFVLDFSESAQKGIKAQGGAKLTVQLLCGDSGASATIYNGMTVLTALQRRVDASAVASQHANLDDYMNDCIIPSEYFSNAEFINQVEEGDKAYAVFTRDGDNMNLSGWDEPIPSQVNNAGKFLKTSGDGMSWYQIQASDVGALPDTTKYGATFDLSMDASTFVITATLKDQDGNTLGSTQTIDLPLESVVVNGSYDNTTKSLILTLQNGNTIKVPVGDLVSGLQFVATTGDTMTGDLNVPNINFTNKGKLTYQVGTSKINLISADDSNTLGKINVGQGNVQTNVNSATFTQTLAGIQYKILNNNDAVTSVSDTNKIITQADLPSVYTKSETDALLNAKQNNLTTAQMDAVNSGITTAKRTAYDNHLSNTNNPHQVTKAQVGLGNVDNTSDADKPISTATQNALGQKADVASVYTKSETNTLLAEKQDTISDLGTIRAGAAKGATAVQPGDLAAVATTGAYSDLSGAPTIGDGTITFTQGGEVKGSITTNQSGNTTIALDAGGGSIDAIDGITITKNADDEIQAVATINANPASGATNPIYDWVGTLAEYKAQDIENAHPEWVCFITDDADGEVSPSKSITNCITEIPQDIKVELNNGTLTLKAGSKVYVPNGAGVFNVREITADQTYTQSTNGEYLLFARQDTTIWGDTTANCTSGTTAPSDGTFYNTSNNRIDWYSGGTFNDRLYSLPFAKITVSNGAITSIDQVFNGFGYIGSTVFVLPGVKGLIPNGRNADGSLKSISFTINEVHTATFSGTADYTTLALSADGWIGEAVGYSYAEDINYIIWGDDKRNIQYNNILFGSCSLLSGAISNFYTKTVFHAVDYSEFAEHKLVSFQSPTSGNNFTWYRKYSDDWVEQGGVTSITLTDTEGATGFNITFPVPMASSSYNFSVSPRTGWAYSLIGGAETQTTTTLGGYYRASAGEFPRVMVLYWRVEGVATR